MLVCRHVHDREPDGMADLSENAAMAAGSYISARPRIDLRHFARGEDLLLLEHRDAAAIAAGTVGPDARANKFNGIDNVLRAVITDLAMRPLRGVAADRQ